VLLGVKKNFVPKFAPTKKTTSILSRNNPGSATNIWSVGLPVVIDRLEKLIRYLYSKIPNTSDHVVAGFAMSGGSKAEVKQTIDTELKVMIFCIFWFREIWSNFSVKSFCLILHNLCFHQNNV